MLHSKKFMPVIVIATVGTFLGVAGFVFASFIQNSSVDSVPGSAESFVAATVTGAQTGTLLPGESALVTLTLTNPNSNVKARLMSVAPGEVFIDTVANAADATYCHDQLELSVAGADLLMPTLAVSEANYPFALRNAVKLKDDTDIRCQAMTFHTSWTAQFQAVR
ncbi:MAG: hypothetical protein QOI56_1848 [Actinomycetota bacterium]|jgi:hypothetical protein|nr:hypothetical protein [Actinomycetota bacterium]MEA2933063.1 hypothetical protein [Actinomycetota bacterium]